MKSTKWVRTGVLAVAVLAVAGVIAVLACGPAAVPQQSGGGGEVVAKEKPTPTPTPTLHPDCVTFTLPDGVPGSGGKVTSCPPPGPDNVDANLRRGYNGYMSRKEAAAQDARRAAVEPVYLGGITVETTTVEAVDAVAEFLEENGDGGVVYRYKYGVGHDPVGAVVAAYVNIELVPSIAAIDGVESVKKNQDGEPGGRSHQSGGGTVIDLLGVDDWHAAGVTGAGVEVAVIDGNFADFRTRVAPFLSEPARYLCYDARGVGYEGVVPAPTSTPDPNPDGMPAPTPTPSFVACEDRRGGIADHGTQVSENLLEIAPDAKLLISDARADLNSAQYVQALDWLTAGESDNVVGAEFYDEMANDSYDVQIINHSIGAPWDGPGDGTSLLHADHNRSLLNIVDDAAERGVLWVNSVGNGALRTWFSEEPRFNNPTSEGIVFLDFRSVLFSHTGTGGECNQVRIITGQRYRLQARWDGSWEGADVDLELHLARGAELDSNGNILVPAQMYSSIGDQDGAGSDPPYELLELDHGHGFPTGDYCLHVTYDSGNRDLDWLQVQMFTGPGDLDLSISTQRGSVNNPGESLNPGLVAVGAARYDSSVPVPTPTLALEDYSARGPVPERPAHTKPEVVGVLTPRLPDGTSITAPQMSGLAALVAQTSIGSVRPSNLAGALSGHRGTLGVVRLPSLEAPTGVTVSHDPCLGRGLGVHFFQPSRGSSLVSFEVRAVQVLADGSSGGIFDGVSRGFGTTHVDIGTDRGSYDVTARTCVRGFCGPWSSPAVRFTTTSKVCRLDWFEAVPGDGQVTLWWSPDLDAANYEVEIDGTVLDSPVSGEQHVVTDLTNGTRYRFRVRSLGPGGPGQWTSVKSVAPSESRSRPRTPFNLRTGENISRSFPGLSLEWDAPFGRNLYEVRVKGGGASDWKRLPFQPAGWSSAYSATYFGGYRPVGDITDPLVLAGQAIVAGLIPGTEYRFAVRAVLERDTGSGKQLYRSPWSKVLTVTTPGVRPANAPGSAAAPALKAPPVDLVAEVDATTVTLSWTAATNPNYTSQRLLRRAAGVRPVVWTEIPLAVDATTYMDTGLTSGVTYRYRVRAYKDNGRHGEEKGGFADAVIP